MKKSELIRLIEELVTEALEEASRPSQSRHYRKSKMAQKLDKVEKSISPPPTPKQDPREEQMLGAITQVLVNIEQFPPTSYVAPDPKNAKKQIVLKNTQQKAVAVQTAERVLQHAPVSKKDLDTLARFILASQALPRMPLTIILKGLVRIFNQET